MEQAHEREAEQVGGQRLLHLYRRSPQCRGDARERGDVGVDGERPQHPQHRQQHRQGPAGRFPEQVGLWVHAKREGVDGRTPQAGEGPVRGRSGRLCGTQPPAAAWANAVDQ